MKRKLIEQHVAAYLLLGDLDKPFHEPECECDRCEEWRASQDRPTRRELQAQPPEASIVLGGPKKTQGKLRVECPHCEHQQLFDPLPGRSTYKCEKCDRHFKLSGSAKLM